MFKFDGNRETILMYAWLCSQEELRSAVLLTDREAWQRRGREKIVQQLMEAQAAKVAATSFYGGLLRYGISTVDTDTIRATLDESSAIFFKKDREDDELQDTRMCKEVTDLLLQSIEQDVRLRHNLELLCQTWEGDLAVSTSALRAFFLLHARLCLKSPDLAFFVPEVVCIQLHRVQWAVVAASILECALPSTLPSLEEVSTQALQEAVLPALLEEIIWQASSELKALAGMQLLPAETGERMDALSIQCRDIAHTLSVQRTLAVCAPSKGQDL